MWLVGVIWRLLSGMCRCCCVMLRICWMLCGWRKMSCSLFIRILMLWFWFVLLLSILGWWLRGWVCVWMCRCFRCCVLLLIFGCCSVCCLI